ncbi:MAG: AAA family ATPase [Muribaculaceae bacterium]|nr:AAA family ATPase [Muribaculaceae bacterium]
MKNITLKRLNLENFKGRTMSFDFSGGRTVIRGTNEAGKSTLCNAFFWLLMGVDAQDRTNYELYDTTLDFTPENAIPAVVDGTFDIDGTEYSFKRVAKQKWVRPRGKSEYVKDKSDEYTFYIDGLAVSANVYKERVEALLAPIDKLKLMLNVRYYQTLDWKKLRKHFSDMVGIIDESELQGDYTSIKALLEKYGSVDAVKEKLRQEINPKKKASESLDAEIKGMKSMLPTLDGVEEAEVERDKKYSQIAQIDIKIMNLGEANKPFVEKRRKEEEAIRNRKIALDGERGVWEETQGERVFNITKQLADIDATNAKIRKEADRIENQRKSFKYQIEQAKQLAQFQSEELERLRKENADIKARIFDENQKCHVCGQLLPYDTIAEIKEKFYNKREADHKACVEKGIKTKENLAKQNELIDTLQSSLDALDKEMNELQPIMSRDALMNDLEEAKANIVPFEQSDIYATLTNEIADMEANLTVVPEVDSAELVAEKKRLNDEIVDLSIICGKRVERENGMKRIESKEKERSEVGIELARLEGLFDKCVEREREWASIVRDRANKHLHYSHVEMIELTKAGELVDVCTLTARKVGSGSQNNATQILIGVDLAQAFQTNAGLNLPIFIDNAEGIVDSNLPDTQSQLCLLYVDERFPSMVIEGSEEYHNRLDELARESTNRENELREQDAERERKRDEVLDALGL